MVTRGSHHFGFIPASAPIITTARHLTGHSIHMRVMQLVSHRGIGIGHRRRCHALTIHHSPRPLAGCSPGTGSLIPFVALRYLESPATSYTTRLATFER